MEIKTHKNKAGMKCRWAIGILFNDGIRFVTSLDNSNKSFFWEADKEPMYFDSKSYVDDIAFGIQMNLYPAVVMEIPYGYEIRNPKKEEEEESLQENNLKTIQTGK